MKLMMSETTVLLWHDVIKQAEQRCSIILDANLETYLTSLLIRYVNKPEVTQQVFATAFLEALHAGEHQRHIHLQHVGDQCLIFAGLFPQSAAKKHVKVSYFVGIGRSAYATLSDKAHDLYWSLAYQFVGLMDVLQSIRQYPDLLPLEAYEQWNDLGSHRALWVLQQYTRGMPLKK